MIIFIDPKGRPNLGDIADWLEETPWWRIVLVVVGGVLLGLLPHFLWGPK